ncbi:uncharacterized protein LOC126881609 [Diabrotica virgifera virgifera]|uniref:Uncharacterized protein n=1 Tax=Diabrotica virgifera virgifera TaxID=50390 RepID=A0ABM5JVG5_DIAVI|nr:uncharacterized protein LOC126881609 [Diabrotica virgifera virgifera]
MTSKVVLVLVLALLAFTAAEKQETRSKEIGNALDGIFRSFIPAEISSRNAEEHLRRRSVDSQIGIDINNTVEKLVEAVSELIHINVEVINNPQNRDLPLKAARDVVFEITSNLNEFVKFILNYFLNSLTQMIGQLILSPVRSLLDYLLDFMLPCGVTCTVLAD